MRIIKKGKDPKTIEYEKECIMCGTIFAFYEDECKKYINERHITAYNIKCPFCSYSMKTYSLERLK